jgi:hypothetical protein
MQDAVRSVGVVNPVDNTDWLKTTAIIFAAAGHFGYFFMEDERWWSVVGRLAAPVLFFLLGYARSRTVPLYWIWLGIFLTLLDVWNADWGWMPVNILLSFALIRIARPSAQKLLQDHGWIAFVLMAAMLIGLMPAGVKVADYGTGGWLWALFGVCHRLYVDGDTARHGNAQDLSPLARSTGATNTGLMPVFACAVAALVYVWQEHQEFRFPPAHLAAFITGLGVLCVSLCVFRRGPSHLQPSEPIAGMLRFVGRHTLEIYAIQLAGSELAIKLFPDLAG